MNSVKFVEDVGDSEINKSNEFKSIFNSIGVYSETASKNISLHHFIYEDGSGELRTKAVQHICTKASDFMSGNSVRAVKLLFSDGHWEYGFKWSIHKDMVVNRRGKLNPIYIKIGSVNQKSGGLDYSTGIITSMRIDQLHRINEDLIEEAMQARSKHKEYDKVIDLLSEDIATSCVTYSIPPGMTEFADRLPWNTRPKPNKYHSQYFMNDCNSSSIIPNYNIGDSVYLTNGWNISVGLENPINEPDDIVCYEYLKSMYVDVIQHRVVNGIIPISYLLSITKSESGYGYDKNDKEVWNNLDMTVSGKCI